MAAIDIADGIYEREIREVNGRTGNEVAERLRAQAEELRAMQKETRANIEGVLTGNDDMPSPEDFKRMQDIGNETRERMDDVLKDVPPEEAENGGKPVDLKEVADTLDDAGEAIEEHAGDMTIEELDDGVAGQAKLGTAGSEKIDLMKNPRNADTLVDESALIGVVRHEEFHTEQKAPAAASVTVDGKDVSAREFTEAGAIAAQEGEGFHTLSDEYRALYRKVTALMPQDQLVELSREGRFQEFAQQAATKEYAIAA